MTLAGRMNGQPAHDCDQGHHKQLMQVMHGEVPAFDADTGYIWLALETDRGDHKVKKQAENSSFEKNYWWQPQEVTNKPATVRAGKCQISALHEYKLHCAGTQLYRTQDDHRLTFSSARQLAIQVKGIASTA